MQRYHKDPNIPASLRRRKIFDFRGLSLIGDSTFNSHGLDGLISAGAFLRDNAAVEVENYDRELFFEHIRKEGVDKYDIFYCLNAACYVVPTETAFAEFTPKKEEQEKAQPEFVPVPRSSRNCGMCVHFRNFYTDTLLCMHARHVRHVFPKFRAKDCSDFQCKKKSELKEDDTVE